MSLKPFVYCILATILILAALSVFLQSENSPENIWEIHDPLFLPGSQGSFDEVSVKDPSVVFFQNKWHLFYTARNKEEYTTAYVSAENLGDLQSAPRHELKMIRGKTRYGCAPQVFFFTPLKKWFLIFQNRDTNYQPAYSTTQKISEPKSWSTPKPLLKKDTVEKWIDFWVICDETTAYLFYTQAHKGVMMRSTPLPTFPNGWGNSKRVFDDVHEAVHVYKVRGKDIYHMIYELNEEGMRSFGLACGTDLNGLWKKTTDRYARSDQLRYVDKSVKWTDMVSHGEAFRSGFNERLEYDPDNCRWLIQGILKKDANVSYSALPWKLGIIQLIK